MPEDDDSSVTTLGSSQGSNVALLAPTPPKAQAPPAPAASSPPAISPATQTLNVLSQHDAVEDLRYDMSQLESDAAVILSQKLDVSSSTLPQQQADDEKGETHESPPRQKQQSTSELQKISSKTAESRRPSAAAAKSNAVASLKAPPTTKPKDTSVLLGAPSASNDVYAKPKTTREMDTAPKDVAKPSAAAASAPTPSTNNTTNTAAERTTTTGNNGGYHPTFSLQELEQRPVRTVEFAESTPLGLVIGKYSKIQGLEVCWVKEVRPGTQATALGIQVGDVLCKSSSLQQSKCWLTHNEVVAMASQPRPMIMGIAMVQSDNVEGTTTPVEQNTEKQTTASLVAKEQTEQSCTSAKKGSDSSTHSPIDMDDSQVSYTFVTPATTNKHPAASKLTKSAPAKEAAGPKVDVTQSNSSRASVKQPAVDQTNGELRLDESIDIGDLDVPFCKLCRKNGSVSGKGKVHHALCPMHPDFEDSGALEKLEQIRRGVNRGCKACAFHFQNGHSSKTNDKEHLDGCERKSQAGRKTSQNVGGGVSKANATQTKNRSHESHKRSASAVKSTKGRNIRVTDKAREGRDELERMAEDGDNESTGSQYKPPEKKKHSMPSSKKAARPIVVVTPKETARRGKQTKRSECLMSDQTTSSRSSRLAQAEKKASVTKKTAATHETHGNQQIKPVWEPCCNPWGDSGHQEGDVVIAADGFTHHEVIFPQRRFVDIPFASGSSYYSTHYSPEEGFTVLQLSRGPMATLPWGFTFSCHDFGGACLVDSVDPLSPASAATLQGSSRRTALSANDMIISVNGKVIGNMTVLGLEIELETSGPRLELVVSRYRFAAQSLQQAEQEENTALDNLESELDDKTRLGWCEVQLVATNKQSSTAGSTLNGDDSRSGDSKPTSSTFAKASDEADDISNGPDKVGGHQDLVSLDPVRKAVLHVEDSFVPDGDDSLHSSGKQDSSRHEVESTLGDGASDSVSENWDDDDEPWAGCVCGATHRAPTPVFWIQCDECETWYNVSEKCVDLDEEDAQELSNWHCWACSDSDDDQDEGSTHGLISKETTGPSLTTKSSTSQLDATSLGRNTSSEIVPDTTTRQVKSNLQDSRPNTNATSSDGSKGEPPAMDSTKKSTKRMHGEKPSGMPKGSVAPSSEPVQNEDGTYRRPRGPAPRGATWCSEWGMFVPWKASEEVVKRSPREPARKQSSRKLALPKKKESRSQKRKRQFEKGDFVVVAERVRLGFPNKERAVGKVIDFHHDNDRGLLLDIQYSLSRKTTELGVEAQYVEAYEFEATRRSRSRIAEGKGST